MLHVTSSTQEQKRNIIWFKQKREAFISLKDHKENFQNNLNADSSTQQKAIQEKLVNQY